MFRAFPNLILQDYEPYLELAVTDASLHGRVDFFAAVTYKSRDQGPVSRKFRKVFGPEKTTFKVRC